MGANVLTTQLQNGQVNKPTILSAVKDSGVIDVTLEEGEQGCDEKMEVQDENSQNSDYSDTRRHQETQTELCSLPCPITDIVASEPTTDEESL